MYLNVIACKFENVICYIIPLITGCKICIFGIYIDETNVFWSKLERFSCCRKKCLNYLLPSSDYKINYIKK